MFLSRDNENIVGRVVNDRPCYLYVFADIMPSFYHKTSAENFGGKIRNFCRFVSSLCSEVGK